MNKIGMCQACGGSFDRTKTIMDSTGEYCPSCADMLGEPDEDFDEHPEEETVCSLCMGSCEDPNHNGATCPRCKGTGYE